SIVGRKSLKDAMWWFTMERSRKNASIRSRMSSPPDHQTVGFRHAGRAAHARHPDDPALLDRSFDLLEDLDHGVTLPDLRELVPCDLQGLQDPVCLFLRDQPML